MSNTKKTPNACLVCGRPEGANECFRRVLDADLATCGWVCIGCTHIELDDYREDGEDEEDND